MPTPPTRRRRGWHSRSAAESGSGGDDGDRAVAVGQLGGVEGVPARPLRFDREGPVSVSDLAAAEKVRPQSMAQTVGELEADGLVKRRPDPDDRRRALVDLTPAGRETLEDDRGRRVGWLVSAIEELPARDQAVLARATAIIGRLAERPD
ncbi:MAG TPA: MarR family transcriptional regulator [Solirubrobacterales bacterium]